MSELTTTVLPYRQLYDFTEKASLAPDLPGEDAMLASGQSFGNSRQTRINIRIQISNINFK